MYQLILITFVIIQTGAINYSDFVDYCELDCWSPFGSQKHTVCERSNAKCGPHQRCRNFRVLPMTDAFRQAIVDKHNVLRNKVALGQEKRGPQPKAANMNVLNWNDELAFIAQCWANTCQMINHDKCRRTEHLLVGQNMALRGQSWSTGLEDVELSKSFIQSWYDEVEIYNPANIQYFIGTPGIGHYTEMVWAGIQYVGCGGALYTDGGWYRLLLVCNYGGPTTGGNLLGGKVYKIGEPCSKCPSGTACNKRYKGLCGIDYPVQTHNSTHNTKHSSTPGYNSVPSTTSRYTTKYITTSRPKHSTVPGYNFISSTVHSIATNNGESDGITVNNINTNNHIPFDAKTTNFKNRSGYLYGNMSLVLILSTYLKIKYIS